MPELNRRRNNEKTKKIALTASLIAITIVMSFTPVGYLTVGVISITFLPIPVAIGAMVGGISTGTILGLCFGLTSLAHCFGMDVFGTTLMSISPIKTIIICIVPRVLMGFVVGLIFKLLQTHKISDAISLPLTSFLTSSLNTLFFVVLLALLFGKTDYLQQYGESMVTIIGTLITFNAVIEWVACIVLGSLVTKALRKVLIKA